MELASRVDCGVSVVCTRRIEHLKKRISCFVHIKRRSVKHVVCTQWRFCALKYIRLCASSGNATLRGEDWSEFWVKGNWQMICRTPIRFKWKDWGNYKEHWGSGIPGACHNADLASTFRWDVIENRHNGVAFLYMTARYSRSRWSCKFKYKHLGCRITGIVDVHEEYTYIYGDLKHSLGNNVTLLERYDGDFRNSFGCWENHIWRWTGRKWTVLYVYWYHICDLTEMSFR